jgi:F-type H+-transporting ATPase subunit b
MELLKNFGFEPVLFLAQVVNFLVIFLVMKKFLYAPLVKMLEER